MIKKLSDFSFSEIAQPVPSRAKESSLLLALTWNQAILRQELILVCIHLGFLAGEEGTIRNMNQSSVRDNIFHIIVKKHEI